MAEVMASAMSTSAAATEAGAPRRAPFWLWFSLPIALLGAAGSTAGILIDSVDGQETENWAAQSVAQDIANLVTFPVLVLLALLAGRGSLRAYLIWLGFLGFVVYSYVIAAFSIQFGPLFLVHVAVLGLSLYALIGGLVRLDPERVKASFASSAPVGATAALVIVLGSLFYLLWLSTIVPATATGTTPQELLDTGLPTNPVHVIDLAVFLPAAVLAGLLLSRRRAFGYVLAPLVLTTMALFGLAIVLIQVVFAVRDLDLAWPVAGAIALITMVELGLLGRFLAAVARDELPATVTGGGHDAPRRRLGQGRVRSGR